MSISENEGSNTPPPVPDEFRRENPYQRPPNPYAFQPPAQEQPKPFNPYKIGLAETRRPDAPSPNPYAPPPPANPNPYEQGTQYTYQTPPANRGAVQTIVRPRPTTTLVLLGSILLVFVFQLVRESSIGNVFSLSEGFSIQNLLDLGGLQKDLVQDGEWWRLISSMFLHASFIHILFNGLALYQLGGMTQRLIGPARMLVIYFLGGIAGGLLTIYLGNSEAVSIGASGAIFALLGGLIGYLFRHRLAYGPAGRAQLNSLLFNVVLNFVILSFIPQVNSLAHLGGLVGGAVLGYLLPLYRAPGREKVPFKFDWQVWLPSLVMLGVEIALIAVYIVPSVSSGR